MIRSDAAAIPSAPICPEGRGLPPASVNPLRSVRPVARPSDEHVARHVLVLVDEIVRRLRQPVDEPLPVAVALRVQFKRRDDYEHALVAMFRLRGPDLRSSRKRMPEATRHSGLPSRTRAYLETALSSSRATSQPGGADCHKRHKIKGKPRIRREPSCGGSPASEAQNRR